MSRCRVGLLQLLDRLGAHGRQELLQLVHLLIAQVDERALQFLRLLRQQRHHRGEIDLWSLLADPANHVLTVLFEVGRENSNRHLLQLGARALRSAGTAWMTFLKLMPFEVRALRHMLPYQMLGVNGTMIGRVLYTVVALSAITFIAWVLLQADDQSKSRYRFYCGDQQQRDYDRR